MILKINLMLYFMLILKAYYTTEATILAIKQPRKEGWLDPETSAQKLEINHIFNMLLDHIDVLNKIARS
ncbi:hypothetical protein BC833DRAFT_625822 [Globomyces pollinis-pini]|nr:hypothetical protein BC833DRAFT_625822 [Globomyces pollinis-pini]